MMSDADILKICEKELPQYDCIVVENEINAIAIEIYFDAEQLEGTLHIDLARKTYHFLADDVETFCDYNRFDDGVISELAQIKKTALAIIKE